MPDLAELTLFNMPSFFRSTLSLAFVICVLSVILMIFLKIDPSKELLAIITGIVSAYLASRDPRTKEIQDPPEQNN